MPGGALASFIADVLQVSAKRGDERDTLDLLLSEWHKRAFFANAQHERPTEPVRTSADWDKLPDRSFR